MNDLISLAVIDGEPRVDSRVIASQLGVEHKATRQLISQYQADLEEFGLLPFQMEAVKVEGARGTKHEKYALLNEDQSYLLLTYTQNTPQARELKKKLVRAFSEHRKALAQPVEPVDPLAAQIAVAIRGKVLVDYALLRQVVRDHQALAIMFQRIEPLARTLEQQCGQDLVGDLRLTPVPVPTLPPIRRGCPSRDPWLDRVQDAIAGHKEVTPTYVLTKLGFDYAEQTPERKKWVEGLLKKLGLRTDWS